jgi:VanZ family protein
VMAFGVFWEVIEFLLMAISGLVGGNILTVYGIGDSILDLVFNTLGAVVVAVWGTAYLTDVSAAVRRRFADASGE